MRWLTCICIFSASKQHLPAAAIVLLLISTICHSSVGFTFEPDEGSCIPSEFSCADKSACLERHLVCNGHPDCDDSSDELPDCKPLGCSSGEFSCRSNRKCIPDRWRCDGNDDCPDKSDEQHCESGTCSFEKGLFPCRDGVTCVSSIDICDGVSNCPNGDDERGHCNVTCSSITCSHGCFKTPYGPQCTCPSGYYLGSGSRCIEVDECQRWPPVCSQKCANTNGSYACSCVSGYTLLSKTHCIATWPEPVLFYSEPGRIISIGLKQHRAREIIVNVPHAVNIALDGVDDRIYWTDPRHGVVKSIGFNGLGRGDVIAKGLKHPEAIAFDWMGRLVYLVDAGLQKIMACAADGSVCADVIEVSNGHDLVLDPLAGMMYWSEWTGSDSAAILCAGMDGGNKRSQLSSGLHRPTSLALEQPSSTLFWADVVKNTIEMLNLNTGMHRILLEHEVSRPLSLTVFEDHIFWYEHSDRSIYKADKWTGKSMRHMIGRQPPVPHMTVYHPSQHIRDEHVNPCWEKPCSHLCLLGAQGTFRCACPGGTRLVNNYTCAENREEPYLLVTRRTEIVKVHPGKVSRQHTAEKLPIADMQYVTCIDYDWHDNILFFNDFTKDVIRRARLNDTANVTTIIDRDLVSVEGLAVDWLSKNLYWADSGKGTVEVSRFDGSSRAVLLHKDQLHLENPRSVAVDPISGYLFISDWGSRGRIERCLLNGRNCTTIVANLGWPNDITIDFREAKIIWTDAKHRRIEMATEDGLYRSVAVRHVVQHPHAVTVVGNFIYWTDWDTASVHYANKRDGIRRDLLTAVDGVMDLIAVGPRLRPLPTASSGCMLNNGGCSHLCFPIRGASGGRLEHVCGCPDRMSLTTPGGKSCQDVIQQCGLYEVSCGSRCIPQAQVCNGHIDCPDGSDEAPGLCPALRECGILDFACGDGNCINIDYRCDGDLDCANGTDELNCERITCSEGRFLCDGKHCYSMDARCDGTLQCDDGSDEMNCTALAAAGCSVDEHQCPDGKCIHNSWLCDNEYDCVDGDDEKNCSAVSSVTHCEPNEWQCKNGQCIRHRQLCDDYVHCDDGSDETPEQCLHSWDCDERTQFFCYRAIDRGCIPFSFVCDGVLHCDMGEDEYNCSSHAACEHGDFQCTTSGHCVGNRWVCDGSQDCPDGSDEDPRMCHQHAAHVTTTASPTNTRTTPASTTKSEPLCRSYEFHCSSGECIRESQLCDSFLDCHDGSDEDGRCNVHCESDNGGCSHHCHSSPSGPVCLCPAGYRLMDDRKTCIDVNECLEHVDTCSQLCENRDGSFACKCVPGYRLMSNQRSCVAEGARADIIIAMGSEVRKSKIGHHDYQSVVYGPDKQIVAVDFDAISGNIYWSEVEKGAIQKYDAAQRRVTTLYNDMKNCEGLALDWITHNIYLTDALHKVIWVCGGDMCGHVVRDHLERPRAIALHAAEGIMFWSDWGHNPKIERAWMNGEHRQPIVTSNLGWPNGISIDFVRNHLYWVDAKLDTIERVDFLGHGRTLISHSVLRHPYSVAMFEDFIYWSDVLDRSVMRMSKMSHNNVSTVHLEQTAPLDIKIMHAVQQPRGVNYCSQENAPKCSHMCLLVPNGASCLCPVHTETSSTDSALCIESVVEIRTLGPDFSDGEPHGISCDECDNGATCLFDRRGNIICSCVEGFTGRRCESLEDEEDTSSPRQLLAAANNGWIAALVFCLFIMLVLLFIAICYIRLRYRRAKAHVGIVTFRDILSKSKGKEGKDREALLNSSSFENPVYKDPMVAPEKTGRHANEYETIPAADPNVYANYVDCRDQLDSYTNVSDKQALKSDF